MVKRSLFILVSMLLGSNCFAFDIPFAPFDKALKDGKLVFVGFVKSTSVTSRPLGKVNARANIVVDECLKGRTCKKEATIDVDYLAQTVMGTSLPLSLLAGEQVVVILTKQLQGTSYELDSDINGGTDFVFICNAYPDSILNEYATFNCRDSMTGKEAKSLSFESIKSMITMPAE